MVVTDYSDRELVSRARRFGDRLKRRVGGDPALAVFVLPPEDPGGHSIKGQTVATWPLPATGHKACVGTDTRDVWADPEAAADRVADAIEQGAAAVAMGTASSSAEGGV